jgi:hypothetical protein
VTFPAQLLDLNALLADMSFGLGDVSIGFGQAAQLGVSIHGYRPNRFATRLRLLPTFFTASLRPRADCFLDVVAMLSLLNKPGKRTNNVMTRRFRIAINPLATAAS